MSIKYGRGWGGARISLSRGSVLSREYFPSSLFLFLVTKLSSMVTKLSNTAYKDLKLIYSHQTDTNVQFSRICEANNSR